ncbi:DUF4142 domain-containing protein [Sorangium sp. So ce136]|uniref:DUF4142 domain-containing protein n=1 Tax=Sorangium sp. So ce136 TaxID=3133284 RepID=UPI003F055A71
MSIRIDSLRFAWIAALALAGASACSVTAEDGVLAAADEDSSGEAVDSAAQAFTLSSPELAAVLAAFHTSEIEESQIALNHATDPHVLEFAQELLDYHVLANQQLLAALAQTGVRPLDNQISLALIEQSAADQQLLEGLTGPTFDWTYVDVQIYRHREFLAHLQEQISVVGPDIQPGVTHLVPEIRTATSRHLAFATSLPTLIGSPFVPEGGYPPSSPYYGGGSPYYGGGSPYYGGGSPYYGGSSPYYGGSSPYYGPVYSGPNGPYSPARPPYFGYPGRSTSFGAGASAPHAPFGSRRP